LCEKFSWRAFGPISSKELYKTRGSEKNESPTFPIKTKEEKVEGVAKGTALGVGGSKFLSDFEDSQTVPLVLLKASLRQGDALRR
jgi:hypothetical protein